MTVTYLVILLIGMPVILGLSIFFTTRIVWRRLSKQTKQEIEKIREEYTIARTDDQKLISVLKDVIQAQDEQITELKNHIF